MTTHLGRVRHLCIESLHYEGGSDALIQWLAGDTPVDEKGQPFSIGVSTLAAAAGMRQGEIRSMVTRSAPPLIRRDRLRPWPTPRALMMAGMLAEKYRPHPVLVWFWHYLALDPDDLEFKRWAAEYDKKGAAARDDFVEYAMGAYPEQFSEHGHSLPEPPEPVVSQSVHEPSKVEWRS